MKAVSTNEILTINGGKTYTAVVQCTCGRVFKYSSKDKAVAKIIAANAAAGHIALPGHRIKKAYCN